MQWNIRLGASPSPTAATCLAAVGWSGSPKPSTTLAYSETCASALPHMLLACSAYASHAAQMLCQNIMGLYSSPLRIVVAMGLLYSQLGPASLVALGTLILFMPIQVRHPAAGLKGLQSRRRVCG